MAPRLLHGLLALALLALASPAGAVEVAPPLDPRLYGRPPELLPAQQARKLGDALHGRGLVVDPRAPLALREGVITLQEQGALAPTGWLDRDTARLLGLDPEEMLPREAGAGAMRTPGTTAGGGLVGGIPGPASPVPESPSAVGAAEPLPGDADFHLAEARRLAAAAESLRLRAAEAEGEAAGALRGQARKAAYVGAVHFERYQALGGAAALVR